MSIQNEITRISANVSSAFNAVSAKGVEVPEGSNSDDLATLIGSIQTGYSVSVDGEALVFSNGVTVNNEMLEVN